jgi:hypothetical protein
VVRRLVRAGGHIKPVTLETARELIDFGAGRQSGSFAERQLEGAVALHNMLADSGVAYLADEVGMGKTYIALGVVGLMRHFNPTARVLYIAPKENIQDKWLKEYRNFVANNWRITDHRVRSFGGTPSAEVYRCGNLYKLAAAAAADDQRDFLTRLTSFSVPLSSEEDSWAAKWKQIRKLLPWLPRKTWDDDNKGQFKDAYARAVHAVLPVFDLVIVDEGHNLRHGYRKGVAARNRCLALALGREDETRPPFRHDGSRAKRVLVLSATPLETSFREVYNQFDVLTKAEQVASLGDRDADSATQRQQARRFLVRRLTGLNIGGTLHTKNMYRREWRTGGVEHHGEPLKTESPQQKLVVALIQKKVADVLAARGKGSRGSFQRSFQMGMLASFESFMQTAAVVDPDASSFDQTQQTEDQTERDGIDTPTINAIAADFEKTFHKPLPHPKLDEVAAALWEGFRHGRKSLVFVRRVASVNDLADKVRRLYDAWFEEYLVGELPAPASSQLRLEIENYEQIHNDRERRHTAAKSGSDADSDGGSANTFFEWFFRGTGPPGVLSGAAFRKNRLTSDGSQLSTLLEDNHVLWVLGDEAAAKLAPWEKRLRELAFTAFLRLRTGQNQFQRSPVFRAYQQAGLAIIEEQGLAPDINVAALRSALGFGPLQPHSNVDPKFPEPKRLTDRTLFTELRPRLRLCGVLWPGLGRHSGTQARKAMERQESEREMLASAIRLGQPFIELWLLAIQVLTTLDLNAAGRIEPKALASAFWDRVEFAAAGSHAYRARRELEEIAGNFQLITDLNFPEIRSTPVPGLAKYFSSTLGNQVPVGAMSGGVTPRLVRQFRMPGYPMVLISTDVLQEGEDLHSFCAQVYHYGISWTPSAMEQRTGRIDRIGSLAHRRLDNKVSAPSNDKLQVFYPHLRDTVELVQVRAIFRRMNQFVRLLHDTSAKKPMWDTEVDVGAELTRGDHDIAPVDGVLLSPFEVQDQWVPHGPAQIAVAADEGLRPVRVMTALLAKLDLDIRWDDSIAHEAGRLGTIQFGSRVQPFSVALRPARIGHALLLRVTSPVGMVACHEKDMIKRLQELHRKLGNVRICRCETDKKSTYSLTTGVDLYFSEQSTQVQEVRDAIRRATTVADHLERVLLHQDRDLDFHRHQLVEETTLD